MSPIAVDERERRETPTGRGLTRSVLTGGAWSAINSLAPYLANAVVSVVAARTLGPSGMGRQSFIAFVTFVTTTACAAGLPRSLTRSVALAIGQARPGAVRALVRRVLVLELALGAIGTAVLAAVVLAGADPQAAWAFASATVLVGVLGYVPIAALAGTQDWTRYSIAILLTGLGGAAATIGALAAGWGITGMVGVRFVATAVLLLWSWWIMRSALGPLGGGERDEELTRETIRYAAAITLPVFLTLVVNERSEIFFLERFSTDAEIAHYAIAASAVAMLAALPLGLGFALTPALATLRGAGEEARIRAVYSRVLRITALVGLPAAGLAAAAGPELLLVLYGDSYRSTQRVFLMLLPSLLFVPLLAASNPVLTAFGKARLQVIAMAVAAAADVAAAYLLVRAHGALGAAAANVIALGAAGCLQLAFAVRCVGGVEIDVRRLLRAALTSASATAAAFGVAAATPGLLAIPGAVLVFVAVFALLATRLGIAAEEDSAWLAEIAGRLHPRARALITRLLRP